MLCRVGFHEYHLAQVHRGAVHGHRQGPQLPDPTTGAALARVWHALPCRAGRALFPTWSSDARCRSDHVLCATALHNKQVRSAAVDHGADIGVFSQYPGEQEFLWNPLSLVEPNGRPFVEDTPEGIVTILPVRMNMNVKTMTVEELLRQKKTMHLSSFSFIINEMSRKLDEEALHSRILERMKRDREIEAGQRMAKLKEFKLKIVQQCKEVFDKQDKRGSECYVDPTIFRSLVMEMLDCNTFAMSKVCFYLEDPSARLLFLMQATLRSAHRRYVSYLEMHCNDSAEAAWTVCRVKGLLTAEWPREPTGSNDLEMVEDEPRIVSAASEDLSENELRLLVAARANVNAVDRGMGNTAIMRAAAVGNAETVRVLCELRGDPTKVRPRAIPCPARFELNVRVLQVWIRWWNECIAIVGAGADRRSHGNASRRVAWSRCLRARFARPRRASGFEDQLKQNAANRGRRERVLGSNCRAREDDELEGRDGCGGRLQDDSDEVRGQVQSQELRLGPRPL